MDKVKLQEWAESAIGLYLKVVEEVGPKNATSFYNQSAITDSLNCRLLMIGYNPGAGCRFSKWGLKDKLTTDFLIKGNSCFWGEDSDKILAEYRSKWDIWQKFHKMLSFGNAGSVLEDINQFAFTNMIFFGTEKENELSPKIKKYSKVLSQKTLELVPVIAPNVVVLNGCGNLYEQATGTKLKELVRNSVNYTVSKGILYLSIKHTAFQYTNEELLLIGKIIASALANPTLVTPSFIQETLSLEIRQFEARIAEQKRLSAESKEYRTETARQILALIKENYEYDICPIGDGYKLRDEGIQILNSSLEIYTTNVKDEVLQIYFSDGTVNLDDSRLKDVTASLSRKYKAKLNGNKLSFPINKIQPIESTVLNDILPQLIAFVTGAKN